MWYNNIDINNFNCLVCNNTSFIKGLKKATATEYKCTLCNVKYFIQHYTLLKDNDALLFIDFSNDKYIFRHVREEMIVYNKNGSYYASIPLQEPFQIIITPQNCDKRLPFLLTYS